MNSFTSAKEMQASLYSRLDAVVKTGKPTNIYKQLAQLSGVSATRIRYFHQQTRPNLLPPTLDDLAAAVSAYERLQKITKDIESPTT